MKRLLISVSDYITNTLEILQSLDERLRGILLYNSRLSSCLTLRLNSQVHLGLDGVRNRVAAKFNALPTGNQIVCALPTAA